MLRATFVFLILLVGIPYAARSPFNSLLLYLWVAYFRPEAWAPWAAIAQLDLSFFAGVVVVLYFAVSRQAALRFDLRTALLGLFFCHTITSAMLSAQSAYAVLFWNQFGKALVITYLIAVLVTDQQKFRLALLVMALSLSFEGAKQGWVDLIADPGGRNYNEIAFLGDNNGAALGIFMMAPVLVALSQTSRTAMERNLHRFLLFGMMYRGLSTWSRGGMLALGGLLVMQFLRSPRKLRTLAAFGLAAALIAPSLGAGFWWKASQLETDEEKMDYSARSRLHFWEVARGMAGANPVLGVGFHAFNPSYNKYDFTHGLYGQNKSVHSVWFGVLAELGYAGLMLYLAIIGLALRACHRARKLATRRPELADLAKYAVALETAFIVFAIGGSFIASQYSEMLWHFLGLTMALRFMARRLEAEAAVPAASLPVAVGALTARPAGPAWRQA